VKGWDFKSAGQWNECTREATGNVCIASSSKNGQGRAVWSVWPDMGASFIEQFRSKERKERIVGNRLVAKSRKARSSPTRQILTKLVRKSGKGARGMYVPARRQELIKELFVARKSLGRYRRSRGELGRVLGFRGTPPRQRRAIHSDRFRKLFPSCTENYKLNRGLLEAVSAGRAGQANDS